VGERHRALAVDEERRHPQPGSKALRGERGRGRLHPGGELRVRLPVSQPRSQPSSICTVVTFSGARIACTAPALSETDCALTFSNSVFHEFQPIGANGGARRGE